MNFSNEVDAIKRSICTKDRLHSLMTGFLSDDNKTNPLSWQDDFFAAKLALPKLLTEAEQKALADLEGAYQYILLCALRFSFPRGLCAVFQQYFTDSTGEDAYETWVKSQLPTEPLAKFNTGILHLQRQCRKGLVSLAEHADGTAREYLLAMACAWDDRIKGMLRYGFYLGYRCGLSSMTDALPSGELKNMQKKILLTEFELQITDTQYMRELLSESQHTPYQIESE